MSRVDHPLPQKSSPNGPRADNLDPERGLGWRLISATTLGDADFDEIERLGGIVDQYLSHRDEAGPTLARIAHRFGARLRASAVELFDVGRHQDISGSTCYLVPGAGGPRYLFTGDTMWLSDAGTWAG